MTLLPDYSRTRIASWIKNGYVTVNHKICQPKTKLYGGEQLFVDAPASEESNAYSPEPIPLEVVYEDKAIIVINKPRNFVVHPAAGNWNGTLLNALLHRNPELTNIPRAGIVHRLDKDTTGLMVIAKTQTAQTSLIRQLQARTVSRIYHAIVDGNILTAQTIDVNIGRDPHNRIRMAALQFGGKPAITHVRPLTHFRYHTYVECKLETGRTHQIRVHLKQLHHPLVGDPVYGNPRYRTDPIVNEAIRMLGRQALHACKLTLYHPLTKQPMCWQIPLPDDMQILLDTLRANSTEIETDDCDDEVEVIYVPEQ